MEIWEKLQNGDEVEIADTSYGKKQRTLVFDKVICANDYGQNFIQIVFQTSKENLGRRDIPVIYHPKEFKIMAINGVEVKEFEKSLKSKSKSKEDKPFKAKETVEVTHTDGDTPFKTYENSGFVITERDGKFYCPCGNKYGILRSAIWTHKKHIGMK